MKTLDEKTITRFWARVQKAGPDDCWEWTGSRHVSGYGAFGMGGAGQWQKAHRVAYVISGGPIPDHDSYHGLCVCHRCDNRGCVNPAHLFLGTNADNVRDRESKGRRAAPRGTANANAKLTEQVVRDIRANAALCRVTQQELADRFGIDRSVVGKVIRGKAWAHV